MQVPDAYQELIESDADEISIWWKIFQIFFYLLSAVSGYGSAILFYILWYDIFEGHCPIWAQIVAPKLPRIMSEDIPIDDEEPEVAIPDWRQKIIVSSQYPGRCDLYHFISLSSCVFGIAWLILFAMCGKGGYDARIYAAPWRVVPPALLFQFVFSIVTMFVVHDMDYGYLKFANTLHKFTLTLNDTQLPERKSQCDIVRYYLEIYGPSRYDVCQVFPVLRILSWIMAWSWVLGLFVLLLRVMKINDFKLLTITIQDVPREQVQEYSKKRGRGSTESEDTVRIPKKKKRLCTFCCVPTIKED